MELVYPIYVDTPMMTAFLASLEGGLVEEVLLEQKDSKDSEEGSSKSAEIKLAQLLSGILGISGKGDLAKKYSENIENNIKSTVKFPEASLFIRLRHLLKEASQIRIIETIDDFSSVKSGDLIEFRSRISPTPLHKIKQLLSLAPHFTAIEGPKKLAEANTQLAFLEKIKPNQKNIVEGQEIQLDAMQIAAAKASALTQKDLLEKGYDETASLMKAMKDMLFNTETETIIGDGVKVKFLCRIYPKLTREGSTVDIFDAEWRVIGKVIGLIAADEEHNLFDHTVLGILSKSSVNEFTGIFEGDDFNINLESSSIKGPALIVATLGIFA